MHKLEFCLFALGSLVEKKDLSEKLIKLASEAHYYYPEDQKETRMNTENLYEELLEEFNNHQQQNLKNNGEYERR